LLIADWGCVLARAQELGAWLCWCALVYRAAPFDVSACLEAACARRRRPAVTACVARSSTPANSGVARPSTAANSARFHLPCKVAVRSCTHALTDACRAGAATHCCRHVVHRVAGLRRCTLCCRRRRARSGGARRGRTLAGSPRTRSVSHDPCVGQSVAVETATVPLACSRCMCWRSRHVTLDCVRARALMQTADTTSVASAIHRCRLSLAVCRAHNVRFCYNCSVQGTT
jgi:hypothetical protein